MRCPPRYHVMLLARLGVVRLLLRNLLQAYCAAKSNLRHIQDTARSKAAFDG